MIARVAIAVVIIGVAIATGFDMTQSLAVAVAIFDLIVGRFLQICSMIAPTVTMAAAFTAFTAFAAAFAAALALGESGFEFWGELIVKADGRGAQSGADNSPLKKALLTGFHSTAKHNATKAVSPSSETMRTI